ncbi:MAG: hypothetical protein JW797_18765 [Bradymonadales bacterium]|nr:hypothetical protein [Bradymonadales bacterium]
MRIRPIGTSLLLTLALLSLPWLPSLACGDDEGGPDVDVDIPTTTVTVGSEGGRVESGGAAIDIPAGALSSDVDISISSATEPATIDNVTTVGPTVEIGPPGTTFSVPAQVTLPVVSAAIPSGSTLDDVRVYTADQVDGTYGALTTTADSAAESVTASVDHLSLFVAGVRVEPPRPCGPGQACDCGAYYAERPLDITGSVNVGRPIETICLDLDENTLAVLTYDPADSPDPFAPPSQYYLQVLDATTLATVEAESPTEQTEIDEGLCETRTEPPGPTLGGSDAERSIDWWVDIQHVRVGSGAEDDWYEEILKIDPGTLRFSFNRHLNQVAPFEDTSSLIGNAFDPSSLKGRILADGSARFTFYNWYESHIDLIGLDDLPAMLADPAPHADPDNTGYYLPTSVQRIQLFDSHEYGYHYDPMLLTPAADDPDADILIALMNPQAGFMPGVESDFYGLGLAGFRIESGTDGLTVERLGDHGIDPFWHQLGWVNGGLDSNGTLYVASSAAEYETSVIAVIDPATFGLVEEWEMPCIGVPSLFQTIPWEDGLLLRSAFSVAEGVDYLMFIRNGEVLAFTELPQGRDRNIWMLTGEADGRLFVADKQKADIMAVRLPE